MPRLHSLAASACALLLLAGSGLAQTETSPPSLAPFLDSVNVEVVNVDVWVTDREGQPVTDLTRDDFVVRRDGEPVEVTHFYAVMEGRERPIPASEEVAAAPEAGAQSSIASVEPPPPLASKHQLWLVVFVDNFNIMPLQRNRILPELQAFLGQMLRAGDQAMLATYDRALEIRQPFTTDPLALYEALDELEQESGHAVVRWRERTQTLEAISEASSPTQALTYARHYAESQMNDVVFTTRALERIIESLAGLPGRKALVYVTSGVPMMAGQEMFEAVGTTFQSSEAYAEIPRHDTTRDFERVGRQATANRVVFYTMDASGLRGMALGAAEFGNFRPGLRSAIESAVLNSEQSALRLLADETGGRAILNQNAVLPALLEASQDFRSFYSLGINNPNVDGTRFHSIEVEVKRKGVQVRHRKGYRSRTSDSRMGDRVRAALFYGHQDNPLGAKVALGQTQPDADSRNHVLPVQVSVPLESVVLLPTSPGKYEMRLRLYVGVVDERGNVSEIDAIPLGLRLEEAHLAAARGESFVYTHRLLVDSGRQKLALGLLDQFGNVSSVLSGFVTPGE